MKNFTLFSVGALGYSIMEILYRGFTHWTMALTGGLCLIMLWYIAKALHFAPLALQALLGGISITVSELCVGIIVNVWLGWNVWDYSEHTVNFLGQISLQFTVVWVVLSAFICLIMQKFVKRQNMKTFKKHAENL